MKEILIRTLKITLATIIAIIIADYFKLNYSFSAGIIAMLSVLETRKETFKMAYQRLLSLICGLVLGLVLFYLFGYSLVVFAIILLIYIPLSIKLNIMSGLVPSSVLLSHFMLAKTITTSQIINAFGLMFVGLIVATIINFYMPSLNKDIEQIKSIIEINIAKILKNYSNLLMTENKVIKESSNLLVELESNLVKFENLVRKELGNSLFTNATFDYNYSLFRREQFFILQYMLNIIEEIKTKSNYSESLATILEIASDEITEVKVPDDLLNKIYNMMESMKNEKLPKTRDEFEDRALIYSTLENYNKFLQLKIKFIEDN